MQISYTTIEYALTNSQVLTVINESLSVKNAKNYFFFQKPSKKDNILLRVLNLTVENHKIKGEKPTKYLEILIIKI